MCSESLGDYVPQAKFMMTIQLLSLLLLLLGLGLAISNIRLSGWVLGWIFLSGALLVQGFRSVVSYTVSYSYLDPTLYRAANDWMGLGFSLLIFASMYLMREVFIRHRLTDERLQAISAAANDAIIMMDSDRNIAYWNAAAQRIFGYTESEAQGRKLEELIIPEPRRTEFGKGFDTFESTGDGPVIGKVLEFAGLCKDGTEIITEHSISGVCINGKWYAICIIRGITERIQAEEARAYLVARLESLSDRLATYHDEESHRIGYELEEEVSQQLAALRLELFMLKPPYSSEQAEAHRKSAIAISEQTLLRVREMSVGLRPPLLHDLGLTSALRWHASRQMQETGCKINIDVPDSMERLPLDVERACYHVFHEALLNITRHAQASEVWVVLRQNEETLEISVRDNGVGFDLGPFDKEIGSTSLGLLGMVLRTRNAGGQLKISSSPGAGTEVLAVFPPHVVATA